MPSYTKTANGDIYPMRFVKLDTTAYGRVLQCGAGDQVYGISQEGQRRIDYVSAGSQAAIAGEDLNIHGPPAKDVLLMLGGSVTIGDRLKSDAAGMGVVTTTPQDEVGAIAQATGVSGQAIPVEVQAPNRL
jgi:hypothetical protein